jgi:hypothetical protein
VYALAQVKLQALIERSKAISYDDIIKAILANVSVPSIPKDPAAFHKTIYKLKQCASFGPLLKEFSFYESGLVPYSDLLERVLFRLETAELLSTPNPGYDRYDLKKSQLALSYEKFPPPDKETIVELSKEFERLIN